MPRTAITMAAGICQLARTAAGRGVMPSRTAVQKGICAGPLIWPVSPPLLMMAKGSDGCVLRCRLARTSAAATAAPAKTIAIPYLTLKSEFATSRASCPARRPDSSAATSTGPQGSSTSVASTPPGRSSSSARTRGRSAPSRYPNAHWTRSTRRRPGWTPACSSPLSAAVTSTWTHGAAATGHPR